MVYKHLFNCNYWKINSSDSDLDCSDLVNSSDSDDAGAQPRSFDRLMSEGPSTSVK